METTCDHRWSVINQFDMIVDPIIPILRRAFMIYSNISIGYWSRKSVTNLVAVIIVVEPIP